MDSNILMAQIKYVKNESTYSRTGNESTSQCMIINDLI